MKLSLNTHAYDYKLEDIVNKIKEKYSSKINFDDCLNEIIKLSKDHNRKNDIIRTIELFKNDKISNYDNKNKISVEELLPKIMTNIDLFDKEILLEQIADISKYGPCAQGRCIRLIQLFF